MKMKKIHHRVIQKQRKMKILTVRAATSEVQA